jgi:acyl carrier protein
MLNRDLLRNLLLDVFLLEPSEFNFELNRADVETWDSLAIVAVAVGVQETFGYHLTQDEAIGLQSVRDIVSLLESRGIAFDA